MPKHQTKRESHPHPRKIPRYTGEVTCENIANIFTDCADFTPRTVFLNNDPKRPIQIYFLSGMVRNERINDYVLRPLAQDSTLRAVSMDEAWTLLSNGSLYNMIAKVRTNLDDVAADLVQGWCALVNPERKEAITLFVATEEKRSVGEPINEPALKGSRESFSESLRTNTAMVRRKLRAPVVKIREETVGRHTATPVDVLWIDGIADIATVDAVMEKLRQIDIDGVETTGSIEEYLVHQKHTPFPLMMFTQRPDRFCGGLMEGRVGILAEGLPLGYLLPATIDQFFRTGQDKAFNWMVASALMILRYFCMMVTLLLPALYIALVTFHPEAIPLKLALSISAAKQEVPFSTIFEVLVLLVAFEVLQEAGLRLPTSIGATVSILGGLVVGNAAVEALIVSPAVLIVVAIAGIAGYTQPSQDFSGALRLWRFGLALLASAAGLFGLIIGVVALTRHLAGLESFGTPYLAPFTVGYAQGKGKADLTRPPLRKDKWRGNVSGIQNRRNQK